jgi:hypothetical protein
MAGRIHVSRRRRVKNRGILGNEQPSNTQGAAEPCNEQPLKHDDLQLQKKFSIRRVDLATTAVLYVSMPAEEGLTIPCRLHEILFK